MPGRQTGDNRFGPSSYVVGPELGNGANYTDIQSAITQAVADGFDATNPCTILVRPGVYSSFTMAPGILVEGVTAGSVFSNSAAVIGNVTIDSTTAGGAIYSLKNMQISDPVTALIFQGVGSPIIVDIANCSMNGDSGVVIGNTSGTLSQIAFRECRIVGTTIGLDAQQHNSIFLLNTQIQGGTAVTMSGDARLRCFNSIFDATVDYGANITGTVNRLRMEYCNISAPQEAILGVNGGELVNLEHCTVDSNAPSGFFVDNVSFFEMYDIALTGSALSNNSIATSFIDWQPHAGVSGSAILPGGVRGTACFDSSQFAVTDGFVQAGGTLALSYSTDAGTATPSAGNLNVLGGTGIDTSGAGSTVTIAVEGSVATTYNADSGSATPTGNTLQILTGSHIGTTGAGNTITINVAGSIPTDWQMDGGTTAQSVGGLMNLVGGSGIRTSGNGSNTITINGITYADTAVNVTAQDDEGYFAIGGGAVTITTQAGAAQGASLGVVRVGTTALVVDAQPGQFIQIGNSISTSGGLATSSADGDALTLVFRSTGSIWLATSVIGNWTLS